MGNNNRKGENDEIERIIREELTTSLITGYVYVGAEGTCMPNAFVDIEESIKHFEVRDSDVIVTTYPRSGTTWTQEMVWLIANDLDYERAKIPIKDRFPFLEMCSLVNFKNQERVVGTKPSESLWNSLEYTRNLRSPRFIKTHLPFSLLPDEIRSGRKTPKMIYVVRNPKDVCVSFYHLTQLSLLCKSTLENFCKVFLADKALYGSYWKNVLGYWENRDMPNLLFLTYEDMKNDLPSVVRKVARFLEKTLADDAVERLCDHLSLESIRKNASVNHRDYEELRKKFFGVPQDARFIRSGTVGKYKEEMSEEMIEKFDEWIRRNAQHTGFLEAFGYIL